MNTTWTPMTGWTLITPEMAAEVLALRNDRNRPLSRVALLRYARDMKSGKWPANGEAIKFSTTGRLLDGQHRLAAIKESGVSVRMMVITDLEDEVFWSIDSGVKRTAGQVFSIKGVVNSNAIASMCRFVLLYANEGSLTAYRDATTNDLNSVLEAIGGELFQRSYNAATGVRNGKSQLLTSLHLLGSLADERNGSDTTERLFDGLRGNTPVQAGDPAYTLRNLLVNDLLSRRRRERNEMLALGIKAWRCQSEGLECKTLRWRASSAIKEAFPCLPGLPFHVLKEMAGLNASQVGL